MFRPPVNRTMRVLDRSFFKKTIPVSAATVLENKNISAVRKALSSSKDALSLPRFDECTASMAEKLVVGRDGRTLELTPYESRRKKCLVLRENIKYDGTYCVSTVKEMIGLLMMMFGRCDYVVPDFE